MDSLASVRNFVTSFTKQEKPMPVLFIGHGSPMNGIENNEFSEQWEKLGNTLPVPNAVLVVSAHWLTQGTHVTALEKPRIIYDFRGFPKELYDVTYDAPGHPELAKFTSELITKTEVGLDHEWGLDHGTWTIVRRMYPLANIPVLQLSIDFSKDAIYHYTLAAELFELRKRGVLIIGSGNMVHNLRMLDWRQPGSAFDWAAEMNETFKRLIAGFDHKSLINYDALGEAARLSIPTPDHYFPLMYILGLTKGNEEITFFNDKTVMGSVSMTSFIAAHQ